MLLIYLSIIMILRLDIISEADNVRDLSHWCTDRRIIYSYLTSGAGFTDKSVSMIATEKEVNCCLKYIAKPGIYIILVLEFPDQKPEERICVKFNGTITTVSEYEENKQCEHDGMKSLYKRITKDEVTLNFDKGTHLNTLKITVTSMRDGQFIRCKSDREIECTTKQRIFCMTADTLCDGHNNCGAPDLYDENPRTCKGEGMTVFMVICSLFMVLLSIFLLVSAAMSLVPKRKETFVHSFDQSINLFDCNNALINAEIGALVLYPFKKVNVLTK